MKSSMNLPLTGATIVLVATLLLNDPKPRFVWNASASAPIGLYWIDRTHDPRPGDLLAIRPPLAIARYMDARGYLPGNAVLLKRLAAFPGSEICRQDARIIIDGREIARAKSIDAQGRPLPRWQGCRRLGADERFLVNADVTDSLDGRYFGPFPKSSIVGLAHPLWTDAEGDGRH